ncbi:MAG: hypothetical protein HYX87_09485 [Chloroflexi bacterium]|nr:hypothetical protein [Chloroflexota bacterium]
MSQKSSDQRGGAGFPIFAALLITVGALLLLYNFDILPSGVWRALVKFWPVVLLILGVNIFLRAHPWIAGFVVLLILLATLGAAAWLANSNPYAYSAVRTLLAG